MKQYGSKCRSCASRSYSKSSGFKRRTKRTFSKPMYKKTYGNGKRGGKITKWKRNK